MIRRVRESDIEEYLCRRVREKLGGIAYKFTSPGRRSVPDRMLALPGGEVVFVECKAPDGRLTVPQKREHRRLERLDFTVEVVNSKQAVDRLIEALKR